MKFEVIIDKRALKNIQQIIEYYDTRSQGLGIKFKTVLDKHIGTIETNPFFQIRYENVRCLPVKKFPYMIHFSVNETDKIVKVHAVLSTSRNPNIWKNRIK